MDFEKWVLGYSAHDGPATQTGAKPVELSEHGRGLEGERASREDANGERSAHFKKGPSPQVQLIVDPPCELIVIVHSVLCWR